MNSSLDTLTEQTQFFGIHNYISAALRQEAATQRARHRHELYRTDYSYAVNIKKQQPHK